MMLGRSHAGRRKPVQMMQHRILGMQPGKQHCRESRMEYVCQIPKHKHWKREPSSACSYNNWDWRREIYDDDYFKYKG